VFITLLALCHSQPGAQVLTNALPQAAQASPAADGRSGSGTAAAGSGSAGRDEDQAPAAAPAASLPEDPSQEVLPVAQPEPAPPGGFPVEWSANRQTYAGQVVTLTGEVEIHYRDYIVHADKVVYNRTTTELEAEGHLQVAGGPDDVLINADHGDMRLNMHTGRFYQVDGTMGVRKAGRSIVFSTPNPFVFTGRVLLETGEGNYRIIDGTMTNCHLPRPDWQVIARAIDVANGKASSANSVFKFIGLPLFYFPYLRHPIDDTGRDSGFLIPVISTGSSIRGYTFGEQVYWAINRSMDMVIGSEYYSKRGWAPNGDFRYKGPGLDHLTARWNALLDRGIEEAVTSPQAARPGETAPITTELVNQGGVDVVALGRKDLTPDTRLAGNVEYLSSYIYRLVFNDNYSQAVSSEVASDLSVTHEHDGFIPSIALGRFQSFASSTSGDEVRILHLPAVRYDVLDRPLGNSPIYWGLDSSISHMGRAEPGFHAHNVGRIDFYPHMSVPFAVGGWSVTPEVALRETFYSGSQVPDLTGANGGIPTVSHDALNRADGEASVDIRPPALERDFTLRRWDRQLRHVIEPEITYRYVGGIRAQAQSVLLVDTNDIATNTNELGLSLTQRFYLRPTGEKPCSPGDAPAAAQCPAQAREWASWQILQEFFLDSNFGGALIPNRRNVFDSTLDLTGIAFLTSPRNLAPVISRMRFEAIDNLRIQWDLDYDPKAGRLGADNVYAGYSWGRTTLGVGHSLLNAADENGSKASTLQSQQLQPFLAIGKQTGNGFNLAANAGYDFVQDSLQYAGVQAVYNWNCCGLTVGYRRFALGTVRDETQYLYSFTLANFGSAGDVRRSNSVFRDQNLPPPY
jgi:LPS-assembly protein